MTAARNASALIVACLLLVACTSAPAAQLGKIGLPNFDRDGKIIIESLKANQDWYVGHGDIPQPVDLDQVYDKSYIEYAAGVLAS